MYKTMLIRERDFEGKLRRYVPPHIQRMLSKPMPFPEFEDLDLDLRLEELYDRLRTKYLKAEKVEKREALNPQRGRQKPMYKTLWSSDTLRKGAVLYDAPLPRELSDVVFQ